MGHHVIRHVLFPIFCFGGFVSVGFSAWAFSESAEVTDSFTGSVNVTALKDELGTLDIYNSAPTSSSFDYTADDSYYTLIFGQDQDLNESIGVELSPSISYIFYDFFLPQDGYSYYLNFRTEYSAITSSTNTTYQGSGGLYYKYATITEAYLDEDNSYEAATSDACYQTSIPIEIDVSSATSYTPPEGTVSEFETYQYEGTFDPPFKWKQGSKPTTRVTYNDFLVEAEAKRNDTFTIVMWITYAPSSTT